MYKYTEYYIVKNNAIKYLLKLESNTLSFNEYKEKYNTLDALFQRISILEPELVTDEGRAIFRILGVGSTVKCHDKNYVADEEYNHLHFYGPFIRKIDANNDVDARLLYEIGEY